MRFTEIMGRLTGFSLPLVGGGVSWRPSPSDAAIAKKLITALEDRRVLYNPSAAEIPEHCVRSVVEIRALLTATIQEAGSDGDLAKHAKAMRATCRSFLDRVGPTDSDVLRFARDCGHWASWEFHDALGQMRALFGVHIAQIAVRYRIDVEDNLARILPPLIDKEADKRGIDADS
jgi:hypothetical protein